MSRGSKLLVVGAIVAAAMGVMPAFADPSTTKIVVWQEPCAAETCNSHDQALVTGAVVSQTIQIQASSSTEVGFDWIHLEVKDGNGAWSCLANWTPTSKSFWAQVDWDTASWPSCNSAAGQLTSNDSVVVRLDAHEKVGNGEAVTSPFEIKLNNRPAAPQWNGSPSAVGGSNDPHVLLRWKANPESDIVEYHFVRDDPNGSEHEFAVSASAPGGQGCDLSGSVYECTDDAFPAEGYGGQYQYSLFAFRTSPSSAEQCSLPPGGNCIESSSSTSHLAVLKEPKAATPGARRPSGQPSTKPSPIVVVVGSRQTSGNPYYRDLGPLPGFEGAPYDPKLPYSNALPYAVSPTPSTKPSTEIVAAAVDPVGSRDGSVPFPWKAIAAGLVLMLGGIHLTRVLRTD